MQPEKSRQEPAQPAPGVSGIDFILVLQVCGGVVCVVIAMWFVVHGILKIF
jgi:hypothetical protein